MSEFTIIIIATFAIITAIAIALVFVLRKFQKQKETLQSMVGAMNVSEIVPGSKYEGDYDGMQYTYDYYQGSRNTPSHFKVKTNCHSKGDFQIGQEKFLDKFFKGWGIAVEVQTGDMNFDSRFYIRTNSVEFARSYFSQADKRSATSQVHQLGYNQIKHDGKTMEITKTPFSLDKSFTNEFISSALPHLRTLQKDVPQSYPEMQVFGTPDWKIKRVSIMIATGILVVLGLTAIIWGGVSYPPFAVWDVFVYSLRYAVPGLAAFTFIAIAALRGRSSSHYEFMGVFFAALVAVPLLSHGGVMLANGYYDTASSTTHRTIVVDKNYSTDDDGDKTYYLHVRSWKPERRTEKLTVNQNVYYNAYINKTKIDVHTKPGKYGFEWLVGFDFVK